MMCACVCLLQYTRSLKICVILVHSMRISGEKDDWRLLVGKLSDLSDLIHVVVIILIMQTTNNTVINFNLEQV